MTLTSRCTRLLRGEAGGTALYLVLAATTILVVLAETFSLQARHELRMGAAETEASEGSGVLVGALEEAAILAQEHPDWPAMELSDGNTQCTLRPFNDDGRYLYCRDVLAGRTVRVRIDNVSKNMTEYPIRVSWQAVGSSERHEEYGWVILDPTQINPSTGRPSVRAVIPYKLVCRPNPAYPNSPTGPCFPGS